MKAVYGTINNGGNFKVKGVACMDPNSKTSDDEECNSPDEADSGKPI